MARLSAMVAAGSTRTTWPARQLRATAGAAAGHTPMIRVAGEWALIQRPTPVIRVPSLTGSTTASKRPARSSSTPMVPAPSATAGWLLASTQPGCEAAWARAAWAGIPVVDDHLGTEVLHPG